MRRLLLATVLLAASLSAWAQAPARRSPAHGKAAADAAADRDLQGVIESAPAPKDMRGAAAAIKKSGQYDDPGISKSSNWLQSVWAKLAKFKFGKKQSEPRIAIPMFLGQAFTYVVWALLIGGLLVVLVLVVRHASWQRKQSRTSKKLLDEDEPDRTRDEWLELADSLSAQGKFREAVRALYLACLLRLDEARVIRFDRGQTNWEHLGRIESSPKKPEGLEFREPTKAFDEIWYGHRTRGMADVEQFRDWYHRLNEQLVPAVAA